MKKLIAIIAVALPLAFSARAQWIVYDPVSNIQQILDEAENIAEYVDMVDNQVQQIETLDNQLSEFKNYESLFGKPLVSEFNDYAIQIEQAFRFNAEDTLVFRLVITNRIDAPLIYQPDSFALRAGNRLYPQSVSDADGTVPPKGQSIVYFAVTGTPDGGRNNLSLRNAFMVLVTRISAPPPPPPVVTVTNTPSVKPIRSPRNHL